MSKAPSNVFLKIRSATNKPLVIGLIGITISFLAASILFMSSIPWLGLSDTALHLDYSWQVHKGQLPDFYKGAEAPLSVNQPSVHFVSQHPPLYYLVLSPFVGSPIDSGDPQRAALIAGLITILLGLLCVYVFSWAGWVYGNKRRKEYAIAVPAILASLTPFIINSGALFNDILALLFASITIVLIAIIINKGINIRYGLLLSVVALLGMASRASFISSLLIILIAVPTAVFLHNPGGIWRKIRSSVFYNILVLAVIALGIGWFYRRNLQLSGNWTQSAPQSWAKEILGRPYKSYREVITSHKFILLIPKGLYGKPSVDNSFSPSQVASVLVSLFTLFRGTYVSLKSKVLKKISRYDAIVYSLLSFHVALMIGQQLVHAEGYGGYSMRYVLPIWVPLGIAIAYAALSIKKARGLIVMLIVVTGWVSLFATIMEFLQTRWASLAQGQEGLRLIEYFVSNVNGLPAVILPVAIVAIILGSTLQAYSLWKLSYNLNQ